MFTGSTAPANLWPYVINRVIYDSRAEHYDLLIDCAEEINTSLQWCKLLWNFEYRIEHTASRYTHYITCPRCLKMSRVCGADHIDQDAADLLVIHQPDCWHSMRPPALAEYLENPLDVSRTSAQGWPMARPPASPRPPMSRTQLRDLQARVIQEAKLCR